MFQTIQPLTQEYLLYQISEIPELNIDSSDDKGLIIWDDEDAKLLPVRFLESMTLEDLSERIHISSDIPERFQVDKKVLTEYLWNTCDQKVIATTNTSRPIKIPALCLIYLPIGLLSSSVEFFNLFNFIGYLRKSSTSVSPV